MSLLFHVGFACSSTSICQASTYVSHVSFSVLSEKLSLSRYSVHVGLPSVSLVETRCLTHDASSHTTITVNLICLSAKAAAGRRSASFALGGFEPASGWTPGWSFFIGLLPVSEPPFRAFEPNSNEHIFWTWMFSPVCRILLLICLTHPLAP